MAVISQNPGSSAEQQLKRKRFTLEQYHQIIHSGVLSEGDRVELINGEILEMAAIGSRHSARVNRLNRIFSVSWPGRCDRPPMLERFIVHGR